MDIKLLNSRNVRDKRRRKRALRTAYEKKLIRLHREQKAVWIAMRNLGWIPLTPPIQQGWVRSFVLREDVRRGKDAPFFEGILKKINTHLWSARKDFKKKSRKKGRKIYVDREQYLLDVRPHDFFSRKFTDRERIYFYEVQRPVYGRAMYEIVYRFVEPWRFVLKVRPKLITKARMKDAALEQRYAEIENYLRVDNHEKHLLKLLRGSVQYRGRWYDDDRQKKYKNPLQNRSFASILQEHWPDDEPGAMQVTHINPRQPRGFSFYKYFHLSWRHRIFAFII